jgi:hypothetical protein
MWHVGGEGGHVYRVLFGRPEGKRPLEDLHIVWRITLSYTLGREGSMGQTGFSWLRMGSSSGLS